MTELSRLVGNTSSSKVHYVPYGYYTISEPLTVSGTVIIEPGTVIRSKGCPIILTEGSNWATLASGVHNIQKEGGSHLFYIAGSTVSLSGFRTDETNSLDGYSIFLDTTNSLENLTFSNITTVNSLGLISDNQQSGLIVDLKLINIKARLHRGRGGLFTKAYAYISLKNCTVDYVNTSNLSFANVPAWVFINNQGLELDYVDVTGNATQGNMSSQHGFYFDNCDGATIKHIFADTVGGYGCYIRNSRNFDISIIKAGLTGATPLVISGNSMNIRMSLAHLWGRYGLQISGTDSPIWTDGTNKNISICDLTIEKFQNVFSKTSFGEVNVSRLSQ